jgi:hypothetical protein
MRQSVRGCVAVPSFLPAPLGSRRHAAQLLWQAQEEGTSVAAKWKHRKKGPQWQPSGAGVPAGRLLCPLQCRRPPPHQHRDHLSPFAIDGAEVGHVVSSQEVAHQARFQLAPNVLNEYVDMVFVHGGWSGVGGGNSQQ